jgi:hypothetical protein
MVSPWVLDTAFECEGGTLASLQRDPGFFYAKLGEAIEDQAVAIAHVLPWLPDREEGGEAIAWWCYREAAEVHQHPVAGAYTRPLFSST